MLKKYGLNTFVILLILLFSAVIAYTHSGRTDANGGHYDRKNGGYHYHNKGRVPKRTITPSRPTTPSPIFTPSRTTTPNLNIHRLTDANDRYFPTKLEWLTLDLNAKYNVGNISANGSSYIGLFLPNKNTGAVVIELTYGGNMSLSDRNKLIDIMKSAVKLEALRYGWQDWVKTEVKTKRSD